MTGPYDAPDQVETMDVPPPPDLSQPAGPAIDQNQTQAGWGMTPNQPPPMQHLGFDANGQPVYGYPAPRSPWLKWLLIAGGGFVAAKLIEGHGK